ncbi:MAG: HAMP domain-containing histidine kinase [Clostridia bacterium]|nr:HAMP domain-containing histidine kinase [Clostridia bacterium]
MIKRKKTNKRKTASIFFMVWAAFALFALAIVTVFGLSQKSLVSKTYKENIAKDVTKSGSNIHKELLIYEESGGTDFNRFLISKAMNFDVVAVVLTGDGQVLFPEWIDGEDVPEFKDRMKTLKGKVKDEKSGVVYEGDGEYVYGALIDKKADTYLYVYKTLELSSSVLRELGVRLALTSVFVFLLSFAAAGSISGLLTKPVAEMTQKAKLLAGGDFSVDFKGQAYGSEIYELAETLNFARDEISKADQMQKELIANVSHDFKTPLTMIKAYASMIREISGEIPEKRNKHAQVIIEESDRLASLVSDVLDLSKIRSGIDGLKTEEFDLSEYLFATLEKFGYLSETQGYEFVLDVDDELFTRADYNKIGQVLYNLIGNAVNYTGEDKKVFVSLKKSGSVCKFSVTDTGKGIKPEERAEIWDRYYRTKETHQRPVKGTGLGLSIVKAVLQEHRFRFGVESEEGKGSTFYVLFPLLEE